MNVINMACINPNSPEFKNALKEASGNPLLAEIAIDNNIVRAGLKSVNALQTDKAVTLFSTLDRNKVKGDAFWNKIQSDLQIPKEQVELLKQYNTTNREELVANMLGDYSYAIEINLSKGANKDLIVQETEYNGEERWEVVDAYTTMPLKSYKTKKEADDYLVNDSQKPTQYYSNLTVPGGTNYTEQEIATPAITPVIKGHAQFATDQGIGWFRSDDRRYTEEIEFEELVNNEDETSGAVVKSYPEIEGPKTRRILELQSDLFQKGRDKEDLTGLRVNVVTTSNIFQNEEFSFELGDDFYEANVEEIYYEEENQSEPVTVYYRNGQRISKKEMDGAIKKYEEQNISKSQNEFLQLLNKANNWVTFFVKSIIQDSTKKGYEKVLFPSGNTASKVEGHETLEQFKKQKEDRIKQLEEEKKLLKPIEDVVSSREMFYNRIKVFNLKKANGYLKDGFAIYTDKVSEMIDKSLVTNDVTSNPSGVKFTYINLNEKEKDEFTVSVKEQEKRIDSEINQLKQELERIDREGFGALKPVFNFYETTVSNILKKQGYSPKVVTDEYGNTWNEVSLDKQRDIEKILFQMEGIPSSRASAATLAKMKEAAKQMGISIEDLADYAKKTGLDINNVNGVADLAKGAIAIAIGREDAALTEEVVHIATAIIEQTNPDLMTKMISEIGKYKIYKQVFEQYKDNKYYQFPDGKPNIRKIKKEAVDKLIVEKIVEQSEGNTEFPSLQEKEERNLAQRLWDAVLSAIKTLFKKTKVDIFSEAATMISEGKVEGTVADIVGQDLFLQFENDQVDKLYDKIVDVDNRLVLVPKTAEDKRHYLFDGNRVALSVTEKIKSKKFNERSEFDKKQDEYKQEWGLAGHAFIENTLMNDLIDKDGYAKAQFTNTTLTTPLNNTIQKGIRSYLEELVRSYPTGTRFLMERKAVNDKVGGMIASTIDLIVIEPVTKEDGTKDIRVDVYDWKFTNFDKTTNEDIPWYKQNEWKAQMGEYTKMLYNYGVNPNQLRRARMVPFIANYDRAIRGDKNSKLMLKSLEIGKFDNLKETKLYLLPVAIDTESTNIKKVDELKASLRNQWEKFYKKPVSPEEKYKKDIQMNELSKAIRSLHMKLDFAPIFNVGYTFLEKAKKAFEQFENINYANLTQEEIATKLGELLEFKASAEKFLGIDDVYLSVVPKDKMTEEEKKVFTNLSKLSDSTDRMLEKITKLQREFVVQYALKQGATTEKTKLNVLNAEKELDFVAKTFLEGSKLSSKIIRLASNAILKSRSIVALKTKELIDEFTPLVIDLEKEAAANGKKAFDMIGEVRGGELYLFKKIDGKFWDQISKAKADKNKNFFLKNMDIEKYRKMSKEAIEKGVTELNLTKFSSDAETDDKIRKYRIKKLRDSLDIDSDTFNGYEGYQFAYIFNRSMIEEGHYSNEYEQMRKNPTALKMWQFFTKLNEMGRELGYLDQKGMTFFPLIEATMIDKAVQTKDYGGELKDFFKDLYTSRDYEDVSFSRIDPETGKLKKSIPKYFTNTERGVDQLSRDLTKIGPLWINALMEFDRRKSMESMLLTLHTVEKSKGQIVVENNNIVYNASGEPMVDENASKNADVLETIVDDYLYGLGENLDSIGNIALSKTKLGKTAEESENRRVNIRKGMENSNALMQALAVGLKLAVAIPNYFGVNFHAFINAGNFYTFKEFQKKNLTITTGVGLSTLDKALLDTIVPLNEDVSKEEQRKLAKKQGYLKYLSTWTMTDVAMVTNSWPERQLQFANALAFNDNSMVVDGKIVNIRKYLREKDRADKYKLSVEERRALESTFEQRVNELQETKSLPKIAKIENDKLVIPGVSQEELANYRVQVIEFHRKSSAQMSLDNKAGYRRDTILKSFMMFKNWIPKQISERTMDIQKNETLDEWEYGRVRVFFKVWSRLAKYNVFKMRDILSGNEEGLKILNEILEEKRRLYKEKTGQDLDITDEEFYDLMRKELSSTIRELGLLMSTMALVIAAKVAIPPDDEDDKALSNRQKYFIKVLTKVEDELSFYYNPMSFESMTRGSIFPSLGIATRALKAVGDLEKEVEGRITDDEELMEKAHPTRRFLDLVPGPSQFMQEVLPIIDPEMAKEMGIRVSPQARPMR